MCPDLSIAVPVRSGPPKPDWIEQSDTLLCFLTLLHMPRQTSVLQLVTPNAGKGTSALRKPYQSPRIERISIVKGDTMNSARLCNCRLYFGGLSSIHKTAIGMNNSKKNVYINAPSSKSANVIPIKITYKC